VCKYFLFHQTELMLIFKTVLVLIFYKLVVDIGNLFRNKPIVSLIMLFFF